MSRTTRYPSKIPDRGPELQVFNINAATLENPNFRTVVSTGRYSQTALMSIPVGGDIGAEAHPNADQFIYIVSGRALVRFGSCMEKLDGSRSAGCGYAVEIPAGVFHNVLNAGRGPLKLFTIYAPPQHPRGEINPTKEDAEAAERKYTRQ